MNCKVDSSTSNSPHLLVLPILGVSRDGSNTTDSVWLSSTPTSSQSTPCHSSNYHCAIMHLQQTSLCIWSTTMLLCAGANIVSLSRTVCVCVWVGVAVCCQTHDEQSLPLPLLFIQANDIVCQHQFASPQSALTYYFNMLHSSWAPCGLRGCKN